MIRLICSVSDLPLQLLGDALDFLGGSLQRSHWTNFFSPENVHVPRDLSRN